VQLYDAETGVAIGPPLRGDSNPIDVITQLAFSPKGDRMLARTTQGHWLLWPIAGETRSAAALVAQWKRLDTDNENQKTLLMPSAVERSALRARDPGRWPLPEQRPTPPIAAKVKMDLAIPARAPDTSPLLLDLSSEYDTAPDNVRNTYYNVRPTMRPIPAGVQRIGGVDFDIRGMFQVGGVNQLGEQNSNSEISCLPVPAGSTAALHLLLTVSLATPVPTGQTVANVTLRYVDGGTAVLPIRAGQEVRGYAGNDLNVPLAFATDDVLTLFGLEDEVFSAPRLPNPFPRRPVRCLDLTTTSAFWPLLLLGITVEPASAEVDDAVAVIPGRVSAINFHQGSQSASPVQENVPNSRGKRP
jgi:hypothetical protein